MKAEPGHIIQKPFYVFLLPVFFFLHALLENYHPVLIGTAAWLLFVYSIAAAVLLIVSGLFFKDWLKAALPVFSLMAFNFFFGSFYDLLKRSFHDAFITRYSFILPVAVVLLVVLCIYLKKTKRKPRRITRYLNLLFLVLIVLDAGSLILHILKKEKAPVTDLSSSLTACDTCYRPDIYLIIADEYAGKTELRDLFGFDNSVFETELEANGFHVIAHSRSNYNATVYSMASLLNMSYIDGLQKNGIINHKDMLLCKDLVKNNQFDRFLKQHGYDIYNYSFFDLADKKKLVGNFFYPTNRSLLTYPTLINHLVYQFGARFASAQKLLDIKKNDLYNNTRIDSLTRGIALQKSEGPRFVYTHLNLPHHPFYFDSSGHAIPADSLTDAYSMDKKAYIQYLVYANRKILGLVDHIQTHSPKPPVIILASDHGFRQFAAEPERKYYFMNLLAVCLPSGNYTRFYDGLTNVNMLRATVNELFNQRLPLLKDSVSFLKE